MSQFKTNESIITGDLDIGKNHTLIVADIGSNHKQDLSLAKESIDAVAEAGADAVKFQSIQLDELYLNPDEETTRFIQKLEFPEEWHQILKKYCDEKGILFFSSPTYMRAVDLLEEVGVKLYKLASAQIGTFPQIVEKVASLNKPTMFSTGIATYDEVIDTVRTFKKHGNDKFIILHCNSIYPTPSEKVNMQLMNTYKHMFKNPVGFSDHTIGTHIACLAVCNGASVIEKHFTLDRSLDTPDSSRFACDPDELSLLVDQIRDIEKANNKFEDRLNIDQDEKSFKDFITYRIIAKNTIQQGNKITIKNIKYLRSNTGIDCKEADLVIGKTTNRSISNGEPIEYDDIK